MILQEAITLAVAGDAVPSELLRQAFGEIMDGHATPAQSSALLVALRTRGETADEIVAAARALRERATTAVCSDPRTVDTCGTGGAGRDTFNISTAAAFVVAGAGVPVAKHGNRAVTSRSGSFDVLEALGVRIDLSVKAAAQVLAEVGIATFFAPTAHPAMRHLAAVRRELGVRTVMNCLGPLLNPLGVRNQLVGVYSEDLVLTLAHALRALDAERALVVHGSDGLDELTTTGPNAVAWLSDGVVEARTLDPAELGIPRARPEELAGGDAGENADILRAILDGEAGARADIVVLNAAAALWVSGSAREMREGLEQARESVASGAARASLDKLVRATQEAGEGP